MLDVLNLQIGTGDRSAYADALAQLDPKWSLEIVPNYFKQSLAATDDTTFNYFEEHFGILKPWDEILTDLQRLNDNVDTNTVYKIFLLGRHGEGYHNLADLKYGEDAWNDYWLHLAGDGEIVWAPDPELTLLGQAQSSDNNKQLKIELANGLRLPSRWYSSPFRRSMDTLIGTWKDTVDFQQARPLIKEDFRETIGVHLCDKRSPRSVIAAKYESLGFVIEDGFEENDIYYKDDYREKVWEQALRQMKGFQYIFDITDKNDDQIISITSHSGSIRTQLIVLNHRPFAIGTGGMIPVFVKATRRTK
ncbi:hypothetical protein METBISCDRAFT_25044 [Metschnikowia bicuspidata]|uniref:Phosphoglycerate mutase-like protein n=1 Tax=Metschnikowia bicuspidata TaxID=27322 RepID=A0A4P9Z746_9ASCO|nr:hypothetical protein METBISCDRAFT_25044 [Metschnikowia bicuspidata]